MTVRIAQPHVRHGDPHVTSDDPSRLSIHACLFEALVRRAPGGRFEPGLAASWTLDAGARTWLFELRDARFSDGQPLSANDVVSSLRRVRDEDIEGELGTSGVFKAYLAGAEIDIDAGRVRVRTREPLADLLDLLVDIPIVRSGPDGFLGTTAYRLLGSDGETVVLDRAGVGGQLTDSGPKRPTRLIFLAAPDAEERASMDVEIATDVAGGVPGEFRVQTTVCTTFLCNLNAGPCSSRHFRQALNWATDVPALVAGSSPGPAVPIRGPWTERHLGCDPSRHLYGPDLARATRLLEKSGQVAGMTLDVPERLPDESRALAAALAEMWSRIGIETTIKVHADRPAYALMVRDKKIHDAACFDSSPSSTFRLLWEKFHSGNRGPWWQGYVNPALDQLVDQGRATPDVGQREALYRTAFSLIAEDAPWVFLYNPSRVFSISDRLAGWTPSVDGYVRFT